MVVVDVLWQQLGLIAGMISLFILAMSYMISSIFQVEQLKEHIKKDILQTLASLFLVVFFVGAITVTEEAFRSFFPATAGSSSLIDATKNELLSIRSFLQNSFNALSSSIISVGEAASRFGWCQAFGVGMSVSNCAALNEAQTLLAPALSAFSRALLVISTLYSIVSIGDNFIAYLFALGVFLRCFSFFRNIGGFFMSIGIGFYLIFPVVFFMTYDYYHSVITPAEYSARFGYAPPSLYFSTSCDPYSLSYPTDIYRFLLSPHVTEHAVRSAYIVGLLLPVIWFGSTLIFISTFSRFLGAEIEVGPLERIL